MNVLPKRNQDLAQRKDGITETSGVAWGKIIWTSPRPAEVFGQDLAHNKATEVRGQDLAQSRAGL